MRKLAQKGYQMNGNANEFACADLTVGQINAFVKKAGGSGIARRSLKSDIVISFFKKDPRCWKTLKLGTGPLNMDDYLETLITSGIEIDEIAIDVFRRTSFRFTKTKKEIDLGIVSPAGLGFKNRIRLCDFFKKAQDSGYERCPDDTCLVLRSKYLNQPKDERLIIASEHIAHSNNISCLFCVENEDGELRLDFINGCLDYHCELNDKFVFKLPRVCL